MSSPIPQPDGADDRILICDLAFEGPHGCFEHERRNGCRFVVDLELHLDTRAAAESDRLRDTIDYGAVAEVVLEIGTGASVFLVERLADRMAQRLLAQFPIRAVSLTLKKLDPPVPGKPQAVGIRIHRTRG